MLHLSAMLQLFAIIYIYLQYTTLQAATVSPAVATTTSIPATITPVTTLLAVAQGGA